MFCFVQEKKGGDELSMNLLVNLFAGVVGHIHNLFAADCLLPPNTQKVPDYRLYIFAE